MHLCVCTYDVHLNQNVKLLFKLSFVPFGRVLLTLVFYGYFVVFSGSCGVMFDTEYLDVLNI